MRSCCHCCEVRVFEIARDRLENLDVGLNVEADLLGDAPGDVLVAGDDRSSVSRRAGSRSRRRRTPASGKMPAAARSRAKREVIRFNSYPSGVIGQAPFSDRAEDVAAWGATTWKRLLTARVVSPKRKENGWRIVKTLQI